MSGKLTKGRDVYIAIMVAAAKGRGLSLTAEEVWDLSMDDAIMTRASNGLEASERARPWSSIDPAKPRAASNMGPRP